MIENKEEEYKICEVSNACYNMQKGTYESIFSEVYCLNGVCLMKKDPDACAKYFNENLKTKN